MFVGLLSRLPTCRIAHRYLYASRFMVWTARILSGWVLKQAFLPFLENSFWASEMFEAEMRSKTWAAKHSRVSYPKLCCFVAGQSQTLGCSSTLGCCQPLRPPRGVRMVRCSNQVGSKCRLVCPPGYKAGIDSPIICQQNLEWNYSVDQMKCVSQRQNMIVLQWTIGWCEGGHVGEGFH